MVSQDFFIHQYKGTYVHIRRVTPSCFVRIYVELYFNLKMMTDDSLALLIF